MIRFGLGQAQVFGAVLAFMLLLLQGATALVIAVTALTGLITVTSLLLVHFIWRSKPSSH